MLKQKGRIAPCPQAHPRPAHPRQITFCHEVVHHARTLTVSGNEENNFVQ